MIAPNYQKAKSEALKLLNEFEINDPIIPVEEIAQRRGVSLKYFKPNDDKGLGLEKISGFFDPASKTIYVNSADPPTRQLFTIAHELGHSELGHRPEEFDVLYHFATPIDKNPTEQEVNSFAANLLVPKKMLQKVMTEYRLTPNDFIALAGIFGVSPEVMKYRLQWMTMNGRSS